MSEAFCHHTRPMAALSQGTQHPWCLLSDSAHSVTTSHATSTPNSTPSSLAAPLDSAHSAHSADSTHERPHELAPKRGPRQHRTAIGRVRTGRCDAHRQYMCEGVRLQGERHVILLDVPPANVTGVTGSRRGEEGVCMPKEGGQKREESPLSGIRGGWGRRLREGPSRVKEG